jgi:hypothetical protein
MEDCGITEKYLQLPEASPPRFSMVASLIVKNDQPINSTSIPLASASAAKMGLLTTDPGLGVRPVLLQASFH